MKPIEPRTTSEWMSFLAPLVDKLNLNKADQKDVAFNISEILADASVLMKPNPTAKELCWLIAQIEHHWPYHQKELMRLGDELGVKPARRARPRSKKNAASRP
jgi:hypothetical protein